MKGLSASSLSIAQGNLTTPVTARGPGEIGVLAQTLETMRIRLRDYLQEITSQTRELRESERLLFSAKNQLQATMDSIEVALMVIDRDYRIVQVNATFRHQYAETTSSIGKHCYEVTHGTSQPCTPPKCRCPARDVWETGRLPRVAHHHRTTDNEGAGERIVQVSASPLTDSQGSTTAVVELMWDITEQKRLEQRIIQAYRELYALNAIS